MIIDGWLTWAVRQSHVHLNKVYSTPNVGIGIAMHSMVANLKVGQDHPRFVSTQKTADGRYTAFAAASTMFSLFEDGTLIQHYPVTASTWTSGGAVGNTSYWAVEANGGVNPHGQPLTKAAEDSFIRLVTEWEKHTGRRALPGVNLLQHKEIAQKYGYAPTACASDRYMGAMVRILAGERYKEEEGMTPEQIEEHDALVAIMGGREKILAARDAGMDYLLGYALEQEEQNQLEQRVAALEAAKPEPRVRTIVASALINAGEEIGRAGGTE